MAIVEEVMYTIFLVIETKAFIVFRLYYLAGLPVIALQFVFQETK